MPYLLISSYPQFSLETRRGYSHWETPVQDLHGKPAILGDQEKGILGILGGSCWWDNWLCAGSPRLGPTTSQTGSCCGCYFGMKPAKDTREWGRQLDFCQRLKRWLWLGCPLSPLCIPSSLQGWRRGISITQGFCPHQQIYDAIYI